MAPRTCSGSRTSCRRSHSRPFRYVGAVFATQLGFIIEDIGEIRNIVGFHIRLAYGAVYRHFTETFAHLDLTQKQVSVLWLVDDRGAGFVTGTVATVDGGFSISSGV